MLLDVSYLPRLFKKFRAKALGEMLVALALLNSAHAADEPTFQIKNFNFQEGRVAFTAINEKNKDIYVVDFSDLSITGVITGPAAEEAPAFSPDGRFIAFHSDASGNDQIYLANYDGTDLTQLTDSKGTNRNPNWSPDGKQIVFQSTRQDSGSEIFIMNADGTKQTPLIINAPSAPKKQKMYTPRFSPRGSELLYSSDINFPGSDIVLYEMESKQSRIITEGYGTYSRPSWKPDGSSFAFSYGNAEDIDIWLAEKGKGIPAPLVRREGRDLDPCWSDDGRVLFFVSESEAGKGDFQLLVYDDRPKQATAQRSIDPKDRAAVEASKVSAVLQSALPVRFPSWTPFPTVAQLAKKLKEKAKTNPEVIPTAPPDAKGSRSKTVIKK